ncbi:MAG: hypothetical protein J6X55_08200 [Victivallales bacterium]|nr:hypothetical protein [Victivallales bacterium]
MKRLKKILLIAFCASLTSLALLCAEDKKPQNDPALMAMEAVFTVSTLREAASRNSANAVKALFSQRAAIRWMRISKEFSEDQLQDFFIGSIVLGSENINYSALYNPFWDTILLLNSTGLPNIPKVENFALVSGCKFRGEPYAENLADVEGTVPKANPYAVDLWNVTSRTTKYYDTVYAPKAQIELTKLQLADPKDVERIQIRSAIRLKLLLMFMKNKPMKREANRISYYLTAGHEDKLKSYFTDGGADFIPNFMKLPSVLRQRFIPYCFFPGKDATLFVFFNMEMPRVIVTVTFPRKGISRIMEWYDLNASDELMAVWNKGKEAK